MTSLNVEKSKLIRLNEAAKERLERGKKELEVCEELARNFEANERHWKEKDEKAEELMMLAEASCRFFTYYVLLMYLRMFLTNRSEILKLESKVETLMAKLDCYSGGSSSSSSLPSKL